MQVEVKEVLANLSVCVPLDEHPVGAAVVPVIWGDAVRGQWSMRKILITKVVRPS
jgi:hypothetical protein